MTAGKDRTSRQASVSPTAPGFASASAAGPHFASGRASQVDAKGTLLQDQAKALPSISTQERLEWPGPSMALGALGCAAGFVA
jgi:hypothetical protein